MSYVDRQLGPEERVVFRTRLHPAMLGGAIGFSAFVLGVAALIVARNELAPSTIAILWLAAAGIVVLTLGPPYLRWRSSELAVTTRRVLVKVGIVSVHAVEVALPRMEAIDVEQGPWGRLFDYGTVRIVGVDGSVDEILTRVAQPEALRAAALRQAPLSVRARPR